jgi:hypothetical protein
MNIIIALVVFLTALSVLLMDVLQRYNSSNKGFLIELIAVLAGPVVAVTIVYLVFVVIPSARKGAPPASGREAGPAPQAVTHEQAVEKLKRARNEIDLLSSAGLEMRPSLKLLELASANLQNGDYARSCLYSEKAFIVGKHDAERASEEHTAINPDSTTVEKQMLISLLDGTRHKLSAITKDSIKRQEAENLLRLADAYLRAGACDKAARYARLADDKVNELSGLGGPTG